MLPEQASNQSLHPISAVCFHGLSPSHLLAVCRPSRRIQPRLLLPSLWSISQTGTTNNATFLWSFFFFFLKSRKKNFVPMVTETEVPQRWKPPVLDLLSPPPCFASFHSEENHRASSFFCISFRNRRLFFVFDSILSRGNGENECCMNCLRTAAAELQKKGLTEVKYCVPRCPRSYYDK